MPISVKNNGLRVSLQDMKIELSFKKIQTSKDSCLRSDVKNNKKSTNYCYFCSEQYSQRWSGNGRAVMDGVVMDSAVMDGVIMDGAVTSSNQ